MTYFGKLLTAMVTPFKEDLSIDNQAVKTLTRYLIEEQKTDALVVAGTTGEAPTLSQSERLDLFKVVKDAAKGDCLVLGGTGTNDTVSTIRLSKSAREIGLDGIMVVVPYYNKPTPEGIYNHFTKVANEVDMPIMVYNVPSRTGTNVGYDVLSRLADHERIKALKEATTDFDKVAYLKKSHGNKITIYSGDDNLTLPYLSLGADGVVSVASHIVGARIKKMVESFKRNVPQESLDIHLSLLPVFESIFLTSNPIPIKAALEMKGLPVNRLRPPLMEATLAQKGVIKELLEKGRAL